MAEGNTPFRADIPSAAAIYQLPGEILEDVFELVLAANKYPDSGESNFRTYESSRTTLMLCGKSWHEIAINQATLWDFVDLSQLATICDCVGLNRQYRLADQKDHAIFTLNRFQQKVGRAKDRQLVVRGTMWGYHTIPRTSSSPCHLSDVNVVTFIRRLLHRASFADVTMTENWIMLPNFSGNSASVKVMTCSSATVLNNMKLEWVYIGWRVDSWQTAVQSSLDQRWTPASRSQSLSFFSRCWWPVLETTDLSHLTYLDLRIVASYPSTAKLLEVLGALTSVQYLSFGLCEVDEEFEEEVFLKNVNQNTILSFPQLIHLALFGASAITLMTGFFHLPALVIAEVELWRYDIDELPWLTDGMAAQFLSRLLSAPLLRSLHLTAFPDYTLEFPSQAPTSLRAISISLAEARFVHLLDPIANLLSYPSLQLVCLAYADKDADMLGDSDGEVEAIPVFEADARASLPVLMERLRAREDLNIWVWNRMCGSSYERELREETQGKTCDHVRVVDSRASLSARHVEDWLRQNPAM